MVALLMMAVAVVELELELLLSYQLVVLFGVAIRGQFALTVEILEHRLFRLLVDELIQVRVVDRLCVLVVVVIWSEREKGLKVRTVLIILLAVITFFTTTISSSTSTFRRVVAAPLDDVLHGHNVVEVLLKRAEMSLGLLIEKVISQAALIVDVAKEDGAGDNSPTF
ncbi:hypothetical protein TYRP_006886 [Tyrophagus putrescentiae]|nr:hypothetical protein TYRP_006886 [Tyrophagus putrescentiae]